MTYEEALLGKTPFTSLYTLVKTEAADGASRSETWKKILAVGDTFYDSGNEPLYDVCLDVLDCIAGWCHPDRDITFHKE